MTERPDNRPRAIALHACCGPCLLEPHTALAHEADRVVVVYYNPNIHPRAKYEMRRDTLAAYAQEHGIDVVELEYDPQRWEAEVGVHGEDAAARCEACYRLRMERVAQWAAHNGCDAIATTLTVSPYQDAQRIAEVAGVAAAGHGMSYRGRDFRDRYPVATRRSRELGMYRQNYCGCRFSEIEAAQQREERRRLRAAEKAQRAGGQQGQGRA